MIVSWPQQIADHGGLRSQFHHVIDVVPTILEAAGIAQPTIVNGIAQKPIDGISMRYTFADAKAPDRRTQQYFEMMANRAIYSHGWIACSKSILPWLATDPKVTNAFDPFTAPWELYHIDQDFTEYTDLATQEPEKLAELEDLFWALAAKYDVLPLQWNSAERWAGQGAYARPSYIAGETSFTYAPGMIRDSPSIAPRTYNRSFRLTADVDMPEGGAEGALIALGGIEGGWSFTVEHGKLVFHYNLLLSTVYTVTSTSPVPTGKASLVADFAYDGGGMGKGATVTLSANGKPDRPGAGRADDSARHTAPTASTSAGTTARRSAPATPHRSSSPAHWRK